MTTKLKTAAPALLAAATLFLAACGSDEKPAQATPPATTAPAAESPAAGSATSGSSMTESSMTESSMTESSVTESSTSEPTASSESTTSSESSTTESSAPGSSVPTASSSAAASAGSDKQVVIKAGAAKSFPAKVGAWVKAPGSGPGSIYGQGSDTVVISFLAGSDYAGISAAVKTEMTPVSAGLCGGTGAEGSYTCYLKTADGVINVAGDDLKPVVDFSEELTKTLGAS